MRTLSFGSWGSYTLLSETFLWGDQLRGAPMGTCRCFLSYYRVGQQYFTQCCLLGDALQLFLKGPNCSWWHGQTLWHNRSLLHPWAEGLRLVFACHRTKYSQLSREHRRSLGVLVTQPGSRQSSAHLKLEFTQNLEGGYLSW